MFSILTSITLNAAKLSDKQCSTVLPSINELTTKMTLIFISFGFPNRGLETVALDCDVATVAETVMGNLSFG